MPPSPSSAPGSGSSVPPPAGAAAAAAKAGAGAVGETAAAGGGGPVGENILKPSTLRAWKVATGAAVAFTAFQLILRTDYGDREHVFSGIQRWYTAQVDSWLGVDSEIARRLKTPTLSLHPGKGPQAEQAAAAAAAAKEAQAQLRQHQEKKAAAVAEGMQAAGAKPPASSSSSSGGGWSRWLKWW